MHHVCVLVHACMCALVCHVAFSKTTTARDFLAINCPNEFHALENFVGFVLSQKISE